MTDLGIMRVVSLTCSHTRPQFGCLSCIEQDRQGWVKNKWTEFQKTYKPTKCPECGSKRFVYDYTVTGDRIVATIICSNHDSDGCPTCDDLEVEIP